MAECLECGDEHDKGDLELWVTSDGPTWLCEKCITPLEERKRNQ